MARGFVSDGHAPVEHAPATLRDLHVVILAAGRGTRLGGPKALFELAGVPLLRRVLHALDVALLSLGTRAEIAVVCSADAERVRSALAQWNLRGAPRVVENAAPERERTHSLRLGAEALPGDHPLLVWPVDVPLVAPTTIAALLLSALDERVFRIPCCAGRGGHPVLLGSALRRDALSLRDDETLRTLRDRASTRRERVELGDAGTLLDLDTPSDVARAEALLARDGARPE